MAKVMKTKNIWSVLCKKALVDSQTQLVSIIDIVEKLILEIDITKAPKEIQESFKDGVLENPIQLSDTLTVASYWAIGEDSRERDMTLETLIKDSNGKTLLTGSMQVKFDSANSSHRTFVNLPSFPITGSGTYKIRSLLKDKKGKIITKGETQIEIELKNVSKAQS